MLYNTNVRIEAGRMDKRQNSHEAWPYLRAVITVG
jgi:hypothetical protein